ncbi:hypothetical protein D9619_003538 [Psilocybe cf. subviscida]|uniref:T6SS Phospholipase effector Tle1-like catalytic domain-containing protein n=1 Tax=Psilocybe cf. subviscida TaxID=2480587 RepID=A0A8H5AY53_9AGAR|nr:hypothetical protein D9619_003538 [Psilocybe cf. subviscida]
MSSESAALPTASTTTLTTITVTDTSTTATPDQSLLFSRETSTAPSTTDSTVQSTPSPASSSTSISRSPRKAQTDPLLLSSSPQLRHRTHKRIVVCCDGTWQDGVAESKRARYTNVLRLARSFYHEDERQRPPIPQIVFYQAGVGSDKNFYSQYIEGTTGDTLADKVEEAYAFIAHNFYPGDEIFLFGFSRGAYTARMVAMFIGEIGILDRRDMDHFANIFINFQKLGLCRGKPGKEKKQKALEEKLAKWRSEDSLGHQRAWQDKNKFSVKCVGVWDTVGSVGLPTEINVTGKTSNLFGFQDRMLGEHVEHAFQALAINETRADFDCNKWIQSDAGRDKGQVLKQCWFTGAHSDIGGGYDDHDLSDLTLVWMASQIEGLISLDMDYIGHSIHPVAPWGTQQYHDPQTGIFMLAFTLRRILPTSDVSTRTHEQIHSSVLEQSQLNPTLLATLKKFPALIAPLGELEQEVKTSWPYDPDTIEAKAYAAKLAAQGKDVVGATLVVTKPTWFQSLVRSISRGSAKTNPALTQITNTTHTKQTTILRSNGDINTVVQRSSALLVTSPTSIGASVSNTVTVTQAHKEAIKG